MNNDTLTAGVSPDGIKNRTDIKILICFMLSSFDEPLTLNDISSVIFEHSLANFFEVCDAVQKLCESGSLTKDEATGVLTVTDIGKAASKELSDRLPVTVREKAVAALTRMLTRRRNERENSVELERIDTGYRVTCNISDSIMDGGLMSISLYVPRRKHAEQVRDRFFDDPQTVYREVFALLTGDKSVKSGGDAK